MKKALTIAGSDSGGGAGIQADLKTFAAFNVFGMSAITALTAQNTTGVQQVEVMSPAIIEAQINSVFTDMKADAVKTGMLATAEIIQAVADAADRYSFKNLVVDPVMVAQSGDKLLSEDAVDTYLNVLFKKALVITPNIPEAEALLKRKINSPEEIKTAAEDLRQYGPQWVIIKGGHADSAESNDIAFDGKQFIELAGRRIKTENTHGSGCTFASAIAANLAKGAGFETAFRASKKYISSAIENGIEIGTGSGPVNHNTEIQSPWQ